jgi:hypothetical protein
MASNAVLNWNRMEDSMLQEEAEFPVRQPISPTKSSNRLMRQISALGMEDPIFHTKEVVPVHPSNIFDDMGFNDIPSDMMDLLSIASDPTAALDEGIGGSCRETMRWPASLEPCNDASFTGTNSKSFDDQNDSLPSGLEETSHSSCTPRGFLLMRENCAPISLSKRKIGIIHSHSATCRVKAAHYNLPQIRKKDGMFEANEHVNFKKSMRPNKEPWNASIPSVDINGMSSCSKRTVDTNVDHSSRCVSNGSLLAEAALVLEKNGSGFVSTEMIELAKSQSSQHSDNQNTAQKETHTTKDGRLLPTLSNIFSS